jgi:hypothetical protein
VGLGFGSYQSYDIGDFDSVSLSTGNLYIHIPLISYPQRGTLPDFSQSYIYNGTRFVEDHLGTPPYDWYQWTPVDPPNVQGHFVIDGMLVVFSDSFYLDGYGYVYLYHVAESSGASHTLGTTSSGLSPTIDAYGIDGSIDKNGIQWNESGYPYLVKDPSGNTIAPNPSTGNLTDSVGRPVPQLYYGDGSTYPRSLSEYSSPSC